MAVKKSITKKPLSKSTIINTALSILVAVFFIIMGFAKLYGDTNMIALFTIIGMGSWLMYVAGVFEMVGGVLLLRRSHTHIGALMLVVASVSALLVQLIVLNGGYIPTLALTLLTLYVAMPHKDKIVDTYRALISR